MLISEAVYASHDKAATERKKPWTQRPESRNDQRERYAVSLYRIWPSFLLIPICSTRTRSTSSCKFGTVEGRTEEGDRDVVTEVCAFLLAQLNKIIDMKWRYT